jgi:hypothetical protein
MVTILYTKFTEEVRGILFSRNSQLLIFAVYIGWKTSEICMLQFMYIIYEAQHYTLLSAFNRGSDANGRVDMREISQLHRSTISVHNVLSDRKV